MYKIGLLNLGGKLEEAYIEVLESHTYETIQLTSENLNEELAGVDGVIIYDEEQQHVSETCSLLIKIKEQSAALVWTATKKTKELNRIVYLQLGADGNLNGCHTDEFYLTLRNSLSVKNASRAAEGTSRKQRKKDSFAHLFKLIPNNQSVLLNGDREIILTRLEYKTLEMLCSQPKQALSYEELYQHVWGGNATDYKPRIANVIFHVREKIEENPLSPRYIKTVRSKGYVFSPTER
ncbi:winged helix-turn-helix domain-containing protein [uncultured Enterococcus sp.]|uniref:winged helix-turn-helix domain-containing protein n=1 Tax=uncultured Enterococcus sp. TaxID=167972 RepID=UPI002AA6C1C3|nr:winged helix-turn-helix domain-containing protein [uncultured Enterococcus sp.]